MATIRLPTARQPMPSVHGRRQARRRPCAPRSAALLKSTKGLSAQPARWLAVEIARSRKHLAGRSCRDELCSRSLHRRGAWLCAWVFHFWRFQRVEGRMREDWVFWCFAAAALAAVALLEPENRCLVPDELNAGSMKLADTCGPLPAEPTVELENW